MSRARASAPLHEQEGSLFFRGKEHLDIREHIYKLACADIETIVVGIDDPPILHPLPQTCRKIYNEFANVFNVTKFDYAMHVRHHVKKYQLTEEDPIHSWKADTDDNAIDGRTYTFNMVIDNTFQKSKVLNQLVWKLIHVADCPDNGGIEFQFAIDFDSKTLDVEYLSYFVDKHLTATTSTSEGLLMIKDKLEDAIKRHEAAEMRRKGKKGGTKRKLINNVVERAGKKGKGGQAAKMVKR